MADPPADLIKEVLSRCIRCVSFELNSEPDVDSLVKAIGPKPIDGFFHIAALLDFRDANWVKEKLKISNVEGTRHVLKIAKALNIGAFAYVGSAYSCGNASGLLEPDHVNFAPVGGFRNPYEVTKLEAEVMVRDYAEKFRVPCYIFRPSTIAGRLMEPMLGSVPKFDVFYACAAFLLKVKVKKLGTPEERFVKRTSLEIRIQVNESSGLNIVPADFCAKAMIAAWRENHPGSYHLANERETPHLLYCPAILNVLGIDGTLLVGEKPVDQNKLETLYYNTVGKIYTPYTICDPMLFDTSNLQPILDRAGLRCPPVDKDNFAVLMQYAANRDFGMTF